MKHIQNIISSITLALRAEGRRVGLLLMALVMMAMNTTNVWADDESATLVTDANYSSLGLTSDYVGYYAIKNAGQLYWFAANASDKSAVLTADIVVNQNVLKADRTLSDNSSTFRQWTPISLSSSKTFDGHGHTISGLYYKGDGKEVGLVGTNKGTIKNVGVKDSYFCPSDYSTDIYVGGVCGGNYGTITNCYATGVTASGVDAGGVCACNFEGTITNCYAMNVSATSREDSGGVCGYNSGTITNCYATNVTVTSEDDSGGVCAYNFKGTITNCYATNVTVTSEDDSGGVCACNFEGTITNCYTDYNKPIGSDEGTSTQVEKKSSEAFASGEVCWLLNGSVVIGTWTAGTGTPTWYQKLGAPSTGSGQVGGDTAPVLVKDGTSNTVYYGYYGTCVKKYSNDSNVSDTQGAHQYENFICKLCHDAPASFTTGTLQDKVAYLRTTGVTVTDFTYTRQFESTNWTTWYVPFNLTLTDDICEKYDFSSINNVHQYDYDNDDEADRTVIESSLLRKGATIKANYPYLVRARSNDDKAMTITLQNVTLAKAETKSIDCGNVDEKYTFTGTYTAMGDGTNASTTYSLLDAGGNSWEHFRSLSPQRHYLTITRRDGRSVQQDAQLIEYNVIGYECDAHVYTHERLETNGLYDVVCGNGGCGHEAKIVKDYAPNAEGAAKNLLLTIAQDGSLSTPEAIALTDANQLKDVNATFTSTNATAPTYTRSMSNLWGTIVVPFAITYSQSNTNYKLYKLSNANVDVEAKTGTLTFAEYDDNTIIPAGTPMAVKAIGDKDAETGKYTVTLSAGSNAVSTAIIPTDNVGGLTMMGTYESIASMQSDSYTNVFYIAQNTFWLAGARAISIAPFRAWFEGTIAGTDEPGGGEVKAFNIVIEGETDGVVSINNEQLIINNGKFIENGKVVIIRGGKKYSTSGQRIN